MTRHIEVFADTPALVARALAQTLDVIAAAIARQGYCTLVLAGGSTPKPLYAAIAQQDLPWEQLYIFWGDERYVPIDHPDSNAGMAKQVWLDTVPIPAANIFPMPTGAGDPAVDAATYDHTIQQFFQDKTGQTVEFPSFDLILLGMGDDAHTASLFPHTAALQVCDRRITVGQKGDDPRLTFTVPLLNSARTILFLVAGANKQAALAQVFAPTASYETYPSRFVQPLQGDVWWLLDQAAGQAYTTSGQTP